MGDIITIWDIPVDASLLANHHYTCKSLSTSCNDANYINFYSYNNEYYRQVSYFELSPYLDINDALLHNLWSDDVNSFDSTIKFGVDSWFQKYLLPYSDYLEDTVFCNDRSVGNYGPMNPNGGLLSQSLSFSGSSGLFCQNETDRFSTRNSKALLKYKTGLLTQREVNLLNNGILKSPSYFWIMSPRSFEASDVNVFMVKSNGNVGIEDVDGRYSGSLSNYNEGVKPVISLRPGTEYVSGTGSKDDPYIVDTN